MRIISIFILVLLANIFWACNAPKTISATTGMIEITETYWRLTELKGKPVARPASPDKREVHIKLKKDGSLGGFGGCNNFGGHFELKDNSQIIFSNIMGTMMACSDLETENKLLGVLSETDNYIHNGNRLILNKGNKSPLARFEADYSK